MSDRPPRLDDALRLLREGDDDVDASPELRARVEARLDTLLGVAGPAVLVASAGASAASSTGPLAKIASTLSLHSSVAKIVAASLVFGAGVGSGVVIDRMAVAPPTPVVTSHPDESVAPSRQSVPPAIVATDAPVAPPPSATSDATQRPTASAAAPVGSERSPGGKDAALRRERALIEGARAALSRGDRAMAARLLDEHAGTFPAGQLREDREALRRRLLR